MVCSGVKFTFLLPLTFPAMWQSIILAQMLPGIVLSALQLRISKVMERNVNGLVRG